MDEAKPFKIPKREVWEAFKRVKANQGAAGVDGQSIAQFEANLSGNLSVLFSVSLIHEICCCKNVGVGAYFQPEVKSATYGELDAGHFGG